jgi:hypothetical protein
MKMASDDKQGSPADRRGQDRRKTVTTDLPFPDRRSDDRRSGKDRREVPRTVLKDD